MRYLKNVFGKKEKPVKSYDAFWNWFQKNEKAFHSAVKVKGNIEKDFFDKLSPKLDELNGGFFFLTGMYDDNTVELVITADGVIKNIVFVEELVNAAPVINGWKFTALKPAMENNNLSIEMAGYKFNSENLSFYANDHPGFPDEIDITIVHDDLDEENKPVITNGTFIYLDNYIGELDFAATIDTLTVTGKGDVRNELVPIGKLKDYLVWRQKEFIEKYEGIRHHTDNDNFSLFEAELENGYSLIAVMNTDLLEWDGKASHPWILSIEISYNGENNNGMPDDKTCKLLDEIENGISGELKDFEGYLTIGRQTSGNRREIYFACKDFRKPSKVLHKIQGSYSNGPDITYDIYKDKYWQSFNRFKDE